MSASGTCIQCGCTDDRACGPEKGGPCCWVDPEHTKCSACFTVNAAEPKVTATSPFRERALGVLAFAYSGLHHVVYLNRARWRDGDYPSLQISVPDQLSTYDGNTLTRLVVAAHDLAIRIEIMAGGPRRVKLFISPRQREHLSVWGRHPALDRHADLLRAADAHWLSAGLDR